jgi:hypothetical protein
MFGQPRGPAYRRIDRPCRRAHDLSYALLANVRSPHTVQRDWLGRTSAEHKFVAELSRRMMLADRDQRIVAAIALQLTGMFICHVGSGLSQCWCALLIERAEGPAVREHLIDAGQTIGGASHTCQLV